ncbi:hypothetical protein V6U89_11025 [Micromonospora sp. CPCC 206171]|uniref:hypothetical protein n=1 Tax=Micromonospora sp. CPCC 206171 TaxID=3122405 RepID=UPI002FF2DCAB
MVLEDRNGFFAFESALLVRPAGEPGVSVHDIQEWNRAELWKSSYAGTVDDVFFFAEDIFGCQFGLRGPHVVTFNPETAEVREFAQSIEQWAAQVIDDYKALTGYPLAHLWQRAYGPLPPGTRLVPLMPFVMGGDFIVENLRAAPEVRAMRFYGGLAQAVAHVPDGAEVRIDIKNLERVLQGDEGAEPESN